MPDTLTARPTAPDVLGLLQAGGVYLAIAAAPGLQPRLHPELRHRGQPAAAAGAGRAGGHRRGRDGPGHRHRGHRPLGRFHHGDQRRAAAAVPRLRRLAGHRDRAAGRRRRRQPSTDRWWRSPACSRSSPPSALLVAGRGLALVLADGRLTEMFDPTLGALGNDSVLGVPISVLLVLVVTAAAGSRSTGPRSAGGCWPSAATGPRRPWPACRSSARWSPCTCMSGVLAAAAGVLSTARQGASDPVVRRPAHRAQRDHRGRRRRHPVVRRPGAHPRHADGSPVDAADHRDRDPARTCRTRRPA